MTPACTNTMPSKSPTRVVVKEMMFYKVSKAQETLTSYGEVLSASDYETERKELNLGRLLWEILDFELSHNMTREDYQLIKFYNHSSGTFLIHKHSINEHLTQ